MKVKAELYHDKFQNFKRYNIPKAQLVIADIPYNIGTNAYGSSLEWYIGGDRKNGESEKAGKAFFYTDVNFNIAEFFHFCNRLLKKEPKQRGQAPAMIVFCSYQQVPTVIAYGAKYGFPHNYPLYFIKSSSPQVLKANMKIVGAVETAMVLYRDKLPKFNNGGRMILNWFYWQKDGKEIPRIHQTQKPLNLLKQLIAIFTDPGDVVIDPCAGSGSTIRAAYELGRHGYGFETSRDFCREAQEKMFANMPEYQRETENETISLFDLLGANK